MVLLLPWIFNFYTLKNHLARSPLSDHHELIEDLANYLQRYGTLPPKALDYLVGNSSYIWIKKGTILVSPGTFRPPYYFILKGVLRGYLSNDAGEITTWIDWENSMASSIGGMETDLITDEAIQALEDCHLIEFSQETLNVIYDRFPETNRIGRLIITENLRTAEERAYLARLPQADERYKRFMMQHGDLINRISLKYIASFLNMKLETLSRIRGRY